jgi:hypothetical protein
MHARTFALLKNQIACWSAEIEIEVGRRRRDVAEWIAPDDGIRVVDSVCGANPVQREVPREEVA